jgi:hypothetical protein
MNVARFPKPILTYQPKQRRSAGHAMKRKHKIVTGCKA